MISAGWKLETIGEWLEEYREKSTIQNQHEVLTSARQGLIPQSQYYGKSRITGRDNVGFHVIPDKFLTYRSRSDDGLFFFNRNETGKSGIISHFYPIFWFPSGNDDFFLNALNFWRNKFGAYAVGSSQKVLSLNALRSVKIPIPPEAEQRKIAETLSTWDRAIETTEKLIANSEAQKKALMQQLLTGKKRLPGFNGEWKTVRLSQAAQVLVSNVDKKTVADQMPVRLCNYMDVYNRNQINNDQTFMLATAASAQIKKFGLRSNDVLITKDSERPDDIAVASYVHTAGPDLVCGYHLAIIRPKKGMSGQFLKYLFEEPRNQHYFACRANGATRFGLTVSSIEDAPFTIPSFEEQKKIALEIRTVEQTISGIAEQLSFFRREKTALMQQLLKGKRRVKIKEMAA